MSEFSTTVNQFYREAVAEFGVDGAQRQEVFAKVRPRIRALVEAGLIDIDIDEAIDAELLVADEANGKQADRVLAQLAGGQAHFAFDADPLLEIVVTIGGGLRKQWRDVTREDLQLMDSIRFENARKQQAAYVQWNGFVTPVMSVLDHFATIGEAVAAGAFTENVHA